MAFSYANYVGNGSTTNFNIPCPYLNTTDISVLVNGSAVAFTFLNSTTVTVSPAPANLSAVRVGRSTSKVSPFVVFQDGSVLGKIDLNNAVVSLLYIAQEAFDTITGALSLNSTGNFDALSLNVQNVKDPLLAQDAASKNYVDAKAILAGNVPTPNNPTDNNKLLKANAGTFSWQNPPAGGNVTGPGTSVTNNLPSFSDTTGVVLKDSGVLATAVVSGPGSATTLAPVLFNGTTGKLVQDSGTMGSAGTVFTSSGPGVAPVWSAPATATPTGVVAAFAGSSAPTGWTLCFGQAISRTTFAALFALVGTTYGAGDGTTTFNLPDLRGYVVAGVDNMGGSAANRITNSGVAAINGSSLGAHGGVQDTTLTSAQSGVPAHTHSASGTVNSDQTGSGGTGNSTNSATAAGSTVTASVTVSANTPANAASPHSNTQPTFMLNYIIKN